MPQMAPISWLILFFMFFIAFMMFNMMNYFSYFPSIPTHQQEKKNSFFFNWKW